MPGTKNKTKKNSAHHTSNLLVKVTKQVWVKKFV